MMPRLRTSHIWWSRVLLFSSHRLGELTTESWKNLNSIGYWRKSYPSEKLYIDVIPARYGRVCVCVLVSVCVTWSLLRYAVLVRGQSHDDSILGHFSRAFLSALIHVVIQLQPHRILSVVEWFSWHGIYFDVINLPMRRDEWTPAYIECSPRITTTTIAPTMKQLGRLLLKQSLFPLNLVAMVKLWLTRRSTTTQWLFLLIIMLQCWLLIATR